MKSVEGTLVARPFIHTPSRFEGARGDWTSRLKPKKRAVERFVGSHVLGVSKGLDVPTRVATCAGLERVRARGERQGDGSRSRGSALDRLIIRHFCTDSAGRKLHADEPACRNR